MSARRVFFSDFDGTITNVDFFRLVLDEMQPDLPGDPIGAFYRGELPLFETLRRIFAGIRLSEDEVRAMLPRLDPDPRFAADLARLTDAGWEVHIVSAGSDWYIRALLGPVPAAIHANPGRFEAGKGLVMVRPDDPRIARDAIGIDKAAIVRIYGEGADAIAFAGNSEPDLPAARLADDRLRFARESLRRHLDAERLPYRPFERWHEVAEALLEA